MNLSENILSMLCTQFRHEKSNELRYTQRRAYADYKGFNNIAEFFKKQAEGEAEHAEKVASYIMDRSDVLKIEPLDFLDPSPDFGSLNVPALFESSLIVEQETTASLYAIYAAAMQEGDYMTASWLFSDLIPEQVEEEKIYQSTIDRINAYPACPSRDHDIDVWIGETFNN